MTHQLVQVKFSTGTRQYTYSWDTECGNPPLHVGDTVTVPGNMFREASAATVVALGSPYKGAVRELLGVVSRAETKE